MPKCPTCNGNGGGIDNIGLYRVDVCEVCFTSSWDPCPEGTTGAVPDGPGQWKVCGMCQIEDAYTALLERRGEEARCTCCELINAVPDAVPNPDCSVHGAGFAKEASDG